MKSHNVPVKSHKLSKNRNVMNDVCDLTGLV